MCPFFLSFFSSFFLSFLFSVPLSCMVRCPAAAEVETHTTSEVGEHVGDVQMDEWAVCVKMKGEGGLRNLELEFAKYFMTLSVHRAFLDALQRQLLQLPAQDQPTELEGRRDLKSAQSAGTMVLKWSERPEK